MTEEARYRVLADPRADGWLLVDAETGDVVSTDADAVGELEPGNLVRATLDWTTDPPGVDDLAVETTTRFRFVETSEPLFEAARDCWEAARRAGEAMNSEVTYSTDNEANGVVYTFADGPRDLFAEFRDGTRPLDPLLAAVERVDPPYELFVIDHEAEPFVVVYVVLQRDGLLAETVRDTYC